MFKLAGGYDVDKNLNFDTVLEYDITGESYRQIGAMTYARRDHSVSVVQYKDFSEWCI